MKDINIIYIHSHDTGRYIQPYGYAMDTPNLMTLAEEGVLFRKAFCASPTCSPSRAALLTGQCAHSSGMVGLAQEGYGSRLKDYKQHIVHTLKENGYHTALSGVQHEVKDATEIGYDELHVDHFGRRIVQTAQEFLGRKHDKPFFLSVGFSETHRIYNPPWNNTTPSEKDDLRFVRPPEFLPDTPITRKDFSAFKTSVRVLDGYMGQVFTASKDNNLEESTLIICTTDHGIPFPAAKCTLYDAGTGVMLMMKGPGGFTGGKVIDAMVSHMDVFPTVCEIIGIKKPVWLQGKSIIPLVTGTKENLHKHIFTEINYHAGYEPTRAVRTNRYKYIRRYSEHKLGSSYHCDGSLSKKLWEDNGWRQIINNDEELYDLIFDPNERNNIVDRPETKDVADGLRKSLYEWMEETNDPLLKGKVPKPEYGYKMLDDLNKNNKEHMEFEYENLIVE